MNIKHERNAWIPGFGSAFELIIFVSLFVCCIAATGIFLLSFSSSVTSVQFHPHGGILSTCSADGSIKLWDLRTLRMLQHYSAHDAPVTSIHFHPSGDYLLSTGMDAAVKVRKIEETQYNITVLRSIKLWRLLAKNRR